MPDLNPMVGGSMAPPLDSAKLADYRKLADAAPPQVAEAMDVLADMAEAYLSGPVAKSVGKKAGTPHPSGMGFVVALDDDEVKRLDEFVPWDEELQMFATVFDKIDGGNNKKLRDAAFHLLWLGRELFLDRMPRFAEKS